ncbi:MAG: single-stranded-DNA-specific exonuclease RecJ [Oscillospiraceae bacterium]|jgi:single-stranded-DNA-specific exonuclease|nr:single-stranded-DNA-specific exonuclease RecJ [Oscillospiraceae bacterium]
MAYKRWNIKKHNKEAAIDLAEETGLPAFLCLLLQSRSIADSKAVYAFLNPDSMDLSDPFTLSDMSSAVERIGLALESGEKIAVYGDYDADGVSATVLLYSFLDAMSADVTYYIPNREEGYGLSCTAINTLAEQGIKLIITVDNGISAINEIAHAATLGIEVIITDHHKPGDELPKAAAIIDPHRVEDTSGLEYLAGVGLAFKLVCALDPENVPFLLGLYADIIALGTIADVTPLIGENRCYVVHGVRSIVNGERPGLKALLDAAGVGEKPVTSTTVAFMLAPRINACGRMESPETAVKLLLAEDMEEAEAIAANIKELNLARQATEKDISREVEALIKLYPELVRERVIVIAGEGWHHGVSGIVAARLSERFGKPCVLISIDGETAKGSCRSVEGFSIHKALTACKEELIYFGGHTLAAGLTIATANIPAFSKKINDYAAEIAAVMPVTELALDCALKPEKLTPEIAELIAELEPFGPGNLQPIFALKNVTLKKIYTIGGGKHLKLEFSSGSSTFTALQFSAEKKDFGFEAGDVLNLAVTIEKNEFKGVKGVSIFIKDLRLAEAESEHIIAVNQFADALYRGEAPSFEETKELIPSREDFAAVFRYLFKNKGFSGRLDFLAARLKECGISYGKLFVILTCMEESGLIDWCSQAESSVISLIPVSQKVDLEKSPFLCKIRAL